MHRLHILIAKIMLGAAIPGCQLILGKDCGGDQHIQLFCHGRAERATRFSSIDAAILKDGELKIMIEIEESDIRPLALCGKVFVSGLASHFIHRGTNHPIAPRASFVQVIDTTKLPSRSSKVAQCRHLCELIRNAISTN